MILSVNDVLQRGLQYLRIDDEGKLSQNRRVEEFHKHYGSEPLVVANVWYDLTVFHKLSDKQQRRGMHTFMMAAFFLWCYPKNANVLASRFDVSPCYARGERIWVWVEMIAGLKAKVIKWPSELDSAEAQIFAVSVDGTDFKVWEKKHHTLPKDTTQCSHKMRHGALKYQLVISVHTAQCVGIYGPVRGGVSDKTMLTASGVLQKLKKGKLAIVDGGYKDKRIADKLSWPNPHDAPEVHNFKSRARLRHETFNGRIQFFKILCDVFRHPGKKHKVVMEAVCVIVQYQMDNGSPIYTA
jgi:hypothetical protein